MARDNEMTVNQAGQKGGEKVRELIEKGKEIEARTGGRAVHSAAGTGIDPVAMIKEDHRKVEALFAKFESSSDQQAETIAQSICDLLQIHCAVEEKFFYPVVRRETSRQGKELVQDGLAEHQAVKDLIARLRKLGSNDAEFSEVVILIQENVEHHVEEEEQVMLPLAQECIEADLLNEIGNQMTAYKEQLKGSIH